MGSWDLLPHCFSERLLQYTHPGRAFERQESSWFSVEVCREFSLDIWERTGLLLTSPQHVVFFSLLTSCNRLVSLGCGNRVPQTQRLKQQNSFSLFWRREVWDQGVSRVESLPCLSLASSGWPAILGVLWLIDASPPSLHSCSHGVLPVYVSISKCPLL